MPQPALPDCGEIRLSIPKFERGRSGIFPALRKATSYASVVIGFLVA